MDDRPRIVQLVQDGSDELRRHVVALSAGLRSRKVEPHIVGNLNRQFRDELSHQGTRWVNLPLPGELSGKALKAVVAAITRFLNTTGPVVVHAHGPSAGLAGALATVSGPAGAPLVFTPHVLPTEGSGFRERRTRRASLRRVLERSRAVIACTDAERQAILRVAGRREGDHPDRLFVVAPGVERRRQSSLFDVGEKRHAVGLHRDASIVVTAAPLEDGVAVDQFVRTAAMVSASVPSAEFLVIGEGPRLEEVRALAHELGLYGSTVFLAPRPDTLDIISTCNVYVSLTDDAAQAFVGG